MEKSILQYQISDWKQLSKVQSNLSPDLKISVSSYLQNDDITGTKIEVLHPTYGTLFAYIIDPRGELVLPIRTSTDDIIHTSTILNELRRFGFYVDYQEEYNMSRGQVEFLRTVQGLHFDKIRLMCVYENNDVDVKTNYIVAFDIRNLTDWLNSSYSCSRREFEKAVSLGYAFNISGLEYAQRYNWSWVYNSIFDLNQILSRYEDEDEELNW